MQLIKDFSEIEKIVSLLNSDNQNKLLGEINSLIVKYLNEQKKIPIDNSNPPVPSPVPIPDVQEVNLPPVQPEFIAGVNALKSSFGKSGNFPPPPPLPQLPQSNLMGRSIGTGTLNLKGGFGSKTQASKKAVLNILDCLGYIVPVLTDEGKDALKNPSTQTDIYQLLKHVDGKGSLKEIYMFLFPNLSSGKFIEKIYPLSRERNLNFIKNGSFPSDSEILIRVGDLLVAMGIINEVNLGKALLAQNEPPSKIAEKTDGPSWMEKTKSKLQSETTEQPVKKRLIGDTLIYLGLITKDQLNNVLAIQRWLKNLVEKL